MLASWRKTPEMAVMKIGDNQSIDQGPEIQGKRLRRFLAWNPFCCYCGGQVRADTLDHVPARIVFRAKHRPKGLEVPSCNSCNQSTKLIDLVSAMLARVGSESNSNQDRDDISKVLTAIGDNAPGLLMELCPTRSHWRKFRAY